MAECLKIDSEYQFCFMKTAAVCVILIHPGKILIRLSDQTFSPVLSVLDL